jgi:cache 3/cache 2 fusion protein
MAVFSGPLRALPVVRAQAISRRSIMEEPMKFPTTTFLLALGLLLVPILPRAGNAEDAKVSKAMTALKDETAKLGAPKIEGKDAVGSKTVPALYFGSTKMSNNTTVVDQVAKEKGGDATLFVKEGKEYTRVATTVKRNDGSSAAGTDVDANNPAVAKLNKGEAYYGDATIFGKPYVTGYEAIKDASGAIIGAYFVGFKK